MRSARNPLSDVTARRFADTASRRTPPRQPVLALEESHRAKYKSRCPRTILSHLRNSNRWITTHFEMYLTAVYRFLYLKSAQNVEFFQSRFRKKNADTFYHALYNLVNSRKILSLTSLDTVIIFSKLCNSFILFVFFYILTMLLNFFEKIAWHANGFKNTYYTLKYF